MLKKLINIFKNKTKPHNIKKIYNINLYIGKTGDIKNKN